MWKPLRSLAAAGVVLGTLGVAGPADAAEFTDVLDAADDMDDYDEDTYDPFDFNIEPTFSFKTGRAQINREAPCVPYSEDNYTRDYVENNPRGDHAYSGLAKSNPRVVFNQSRCEGTGGVVENKEMLYRHQEARLAFDARFGIYKDLELHINVPVVFNSVHGLKYANEDSNNSVGPGNSGVDPDRGRVEDNAEEVFGDIGQSASNQQEARQAALDRLNRYKMHSFFDLGGEFSNISRAGFDDPSIGVEWGIYNDERDDTKASLNLGMDYTLPIAPIRQFDNDAVGDGLHQLTWDLKASKQFDWVDPYFGLDYTLSLPARGSPIKQLAEVDSNNEGQSVTNPPHRGNITVGTEFVPAENEQKGTRYGIDLRFNFGYVSEGRKYTPLYEHFVNSECNGQSRNDVLPNFNSDGSYAGPGGVECSWIAQRPANVRSDPNSDNASPTYDVSRLDEDRSFRTNGIMTTESYARFGGHLGVYLQPSPYFQFKAIAGILHRQEHYLSNARTGNDVSNSQEASPDQQVDLTGDDASLERNPAYNSTYDSPGTRFRINRWNTWTFMTTAAFQF